MSSAPSTIRVAIIGGGLAGAALLRGLLRYPHIAVDMYESRPAFREEGPGLAFTTSTQAFLAAIDPELELCLDRAGAVLTSFEVRTASGPHTGRKIEVNGLGGAGSKKIVGRQAFLTEMLNGVPPRMMHPGTRISSVTDLSPGQGLLLTFADGLQKKYDVVVGADGTHGFTRQLVLGADESLVQPRSTGFWSLPIKVPMRRAQQAMGTRYLDPSNPRQIGWVGDGTGMIHNLLDNGNEVEIVVYGNIDSPIEEDEAPGASWAKLFTPDEFQEMFASNRLPVCQGMVDLIQSLYTVQVAAICQLEHTPAPTYVTGNICLIGDSAHSMLPFQGASVSIAIEEALILSSLLGRLPSKAAIPAALQAYDQVCRPRADLAAKSSAKTGFLVTGRGPGVGLDADLLQHQLRHKWDFLLEIDIDARRAAANVIMDQLLGAEAWV
ncbi:FAD/NAD(P)-binding domain-containing protein [Hypoxylon sp. FL1150]|nr:FAD/NAD(P)-binding domain-containing protein [Hypoxylon sp. FL1150]